MKSIKLLITLMVFLVGVALFVNVVSAAEEDNYGSSITYSTIVENHPIRDSFIGRIISSIKYNSQDFSVFGDTMGCSVYPDDKIFLTNGDTGTFEAYGDSTAFVNWFYGSPFDGAYPEHPTISRQFIQEDYITENNPSTFTCGAMAYWLGECYGEIYYCDEPVCYQDTDCERVNPPLEVCDKSIVSLKIPNAGHCVAVDQPTHITDVYICQGGQIIDQYQVTSPGNLESCSDSTKSKFYLLDDNTDSCLDYFPSACGSDPTPPPVTHECGDSVCDSDETCESCEADCGECPIVCEDRNTPADTNCDGVISKIEIKLYGNKWISGDITRDVLGIALDAYDNQEI